MTKPIASFSLKDTPSLIERLLPVQKLSAEAFKEQMAVHGKTLTALGGYWKGRKPLILNRACILGALLPATNDPSRDLEVFEKLMAMDEESFAVRWKRRAQPKDVLSKAALSRIDDYFASDPPGLLPSSAPVDWTDEKLHGVEVEWRDHVSETVRRRLEAQVLPPTNYRERVEASFRPEEVDSVDSHIWESVNEHLGTSASSFSELVNQLGIMRFGHRPRIADTFCGSGQIPFEAARLGCDVWASDLNPVACMLTWAAIHVVGGSELTRSRLASEQKALLTAIQQDIDALGVETDGAGWRGKVYLYCAEARCPQSGWMVPLLSSLVISKSRRVVAELVPNHSAKRYEILVRSGATAAQMRDSELGTVVRDDRYGEACLTHTSDAAIYRTKITTLRGDYVGADGSTRNRVRKWEKHECVPRPDDTFQERLYCVQWMRPRSRGAGHDYEFRSVTDEDIARERLVESHVLAHLAEWQSDGLVPEMKIEVGGPPRYQGLDLIRSRGWTFWHQVFNPRQLLVGCLIRKRLSAYLTPAFCQSLNSNSRLSPWSNADGGGGAVKQTFANQALNVLYNYGCRGSQYAASLLLQNYKGFPIPTEARVTISAQAADKHSAECDVYVTDPPYGDAVKYEEILDFFIAWLRKNPPPEFAGWTWDSRRSLAIKGEDEEFRRGMVAAYSRMTERMSSNGIQVVMFTHQSIAIWADMANIVWASGLQVTAAWYVVTETDSALRAGANVKGTVLLVCRKRSGSHKTTRDDLAWEIQEDVEKQVKDLAGLNQSAKGLYRDENVFEDADIQMAGYAAALRVLTRYTTIDGRDMPAEASRPRVKGETTFVDGLIEFAVSTANQCLVPEGITKPHWDRLTPPERFYLKLLDLEAKGSKTLDNYQNFAKAFKVKDVRPLMASQKANDARLKSAAEFGKAEMSEGSELHQSTLRAALFAMMELVNNIDGTQVLAHLTLNVPDYYANQVQRELVVELADYLAKKLEAIRPEEASAARVLRELVKNQRLG